MSRRERQTVPIDLGGGERLVGEIVEEDGASGATAVLYVHGFGSTRQGEKAMAIEAACARRGWTFAAFDFRGHGDSTGTLLELRGSRLQADLGAIWAEMARRGVARVLPIGSSMGAWAVAWFAARRPRDVPACVLIAPALHFLHSRWAALDDEQRRRWKETGRLRVQSDWVDAEIGYGLVEEGDLYPVERLYRDWPCPALVLHGMSDDLIAYHHTLDFVEQAARPDLRLVLFKDGDHRLNAYKDEIADLACAFFGQHASS
jgi:pimeloyl-ACP methyl ester carboxylesterase